MKNNFLIFWIVIAILFIVGANWIASVYDKKTALLTSDLSEGKTTSAPVIEDIPIKAKKPGDPPRKKASIYSFLQGPLAWQKRYEWSGSWGEVLMEEGQYFGSFGCGLCCIANIYDTLSPYEASPIDVYWYAKNQTSYAPTEETAAIGWEAMLAAVKKMGMDAELARKPKDFQSFQKRINKTETAILLIASQDTDSYWGEISGHYVNIWQVKPKGKTVFIANPGGYTKNRRIIRLKNCYDHLKEISSYQMLLVYSYNNKADQWRPAKRIKEAWVRPAYCKVKRKPEK